MAAEFQYLNYHTEYSCSGHFKMNKQSGVCFRDAFNKIENIREEFTETYEVYIYKGADQLKKSRSNACFMTEREIENHLKQLKSIMDLKKVSVKTDKENNKLMIATVTLTGKAIYHKYMLTWLRYVYEYPYNMVLMDARKLRQKVFITESVSNLQNLIACCISEYYGVGHGITSKGGYYSVKELKNRLKYMAGHNQKSLNLIFTSPDNCEKIKHIGGSSARFRDLDYWQSEDEFKNRVEYYKAAYDLIHGKAKPKKAIPVKKAKKIVEK